MRSPGACNFWGFALIRARLEIGQAQVAFVVERAYWFSI